ncbi:hypothetical protein [Pseudomonas putida]|uniref:hypothetical protein n=1 Tax=Pseudomonas putida TaxID=303 RepID=UPI002365B39A|nr:hypothetical protein [Pseudomonas putida]MDD2046149.1 hypothetical protein [Pseudomonas putida]
MPTENRSSNTEQMVSVPRDEIERLVKLLQYQAHPCPSPHAEFWQSLLDAPATPHQGEVVAWVHMRNGEPDYDRETVISNVPGDTIGNGDSWEPVYRHPPTYDGFSAGDMADQGAKAFAARDDEVEELRELLRAMTCGYRMAVQAGHARITALGGDCDSVDRMLADFPEYAKAIAATKRKP